MRRIRKKCKKDSFFNDQFDNPKMAKELSSLIRGKSPRKQIRAVLGYFKRKGYLNKES